jgi:nitroreductase/Pyruvate/2-oxoacid:ferredoxin oxidoreductase delta subunit
MNLFKIDETKCMKDGICSTECPTKIINPPGKNSFPTPIDNAEEFCIMCGHCVAVCPHGAFAHRDMRPEDCRELSDDLSISASQGEQFLRSRRSMRSYRDEAVSREILVQLIDTARFAPSGHNSQAVEWMIIYDKKDVMKYAEMVIDWMRYMLKEQPALVAGFNLDRVVKAWEAGEDRVCRNAPHIIIAYGPEQNLNARNSCIIALTYLDLAASALKLGACWAGYFANAAASWPPLSKELGFPVGSTAFGAMMVGHPKYKYYRMPLRNEARITWK